jgi:hypothetical protein
MTLTALAAPFEVKASDAEARTFEGLASTWERDTGNDVIHKGAFARTLDHWKSAGGRVVVPLIDQHAYQMKKSPSFRDIVGKLVAAEERPEGLWTRYQVARTAAGDDLLTLFPMNEGALADPLSVKSFDELSAALRDGALSDEQKSELRALLAAPEAKAKAKFGKGDRVEALADHMEGMKGSAGKVTLVRNGPYYGVTFDGERKIHKWLAEDEITAASVDEDESGGSMAGMAHGKTRALPDGGLAPDDPQRVALEETLRAVTLRSLGTAA